MSRFAQALRDPQVTPDGLSLPGGRDGSARFAIYRNNVTVAWTEALAANFPAIASLVGAEFMTAMAREFARVHPPASPVMAEWGDEFADWLAQFPPVASLPYLPEMARLEQASRQALHAADAPVLSPEDIAQADPDDDWQPRLHPAAFWMVSTYPLLSVRAQALGLPAPAEPETGEILITRPALELQLTSAPQGTARLLSALAGGATLEAALADHPAPATPLACLLAQGALRKE